MNNSQGGRPTKYKDEYVKFVDDYTKQSSLPYVEELAMELDVDEDTINNWGSAHPEFFGAIKRLKNKQKYTLQKLGLYSKVNATMAIFQLKCNHGMIETERRELTGKDGGPIETAGIFINGGLKDDNPQDKS